MYGELVRCFAVAFGAFPRNAQFITEYDVRLGLAEDWPGGRCFYILHLRTLLSNNLFGTAKSNSEFLNRAKYVRTFSRIVYILSTTNGCSNTSLIQLLTIITLGAIMTVSRTLATL